MRKFLSILLLVLVAAWASVPGAVTAKPREKAGSYSVAVAGAFKGPGSASIAGNNLTINATVTDKNGATGPLTFSVPMKVDNRFSVTGSVIGQSAQFTGRVDAPDDQKEKGIKGVRISATFKTADNRYGKIMGWIPNDNRMPKDDHPGKGQGQGNGNGNGN